ncbi:MAG TPA: DHA2 family efflux MFS transporter permease subunit [Pseudonocardia sp.]|nr:DHA2 family efflux MFS transporter permease subunit [Pseudonocardia sp.]
MTAALAERNQGEGGELSHRQILTILVGLLLGMFLAALDQNVVSTAIRTIADDLGGLSQQAWATTAFLITSTIATPLYGKLSDIYGRKPLFLLAISIFIVGSVTCTFAQSMYQLAAFRALQGIGAGGLFSLALTILGDIVPPRERARYQGFFLAVFATSSVAGPVIGGLLAGAPTILGIDGWRWIFLINVPIGAVALVVVAKVLNLPNTSRGRRRIDWPGATLLAVGLVPLLLVAEQGRAWGWGSAASVACYVLGGLGLLFFVLVERWYGDDALLPLRLFRSSVFSLVTVVGVIVGMTMFGGIAVLPQFLQIVRGASPIESGFLMLPLVAGIMTASLLSGQATSRTGRYKVFPVVGTLLMLGALVILHFRISVDIPFWELDLYMAMFGLGLGGCMQTLVLAVQNASPARDMGVVTASSTFFRQLGGTLGTAIFFSILFSTLPGNIAAAMTSAAKTDPAFQAAVADPAVRDNAANAPFFALNQGGGANDLNDSAFLQTIDPRLARPILEGFTSSMSLVFLVAACVIAVGFVLVLFVRELPLRTMSGARAAAMEEAARTGEVPVAVPAEAVAADASGSAPTAVGAGGALPRGGAAVPAGAAGVPDAADGATTQPERFAPRYGATAGTAPGAPSASARDDAGTTRPNEADAAGTGQSTGADTDLAAGGRPEDEADSWFATATAVPSTDGPGVAGRATRADGKGLPTVTVTVADPAGHQEARTTTDAEGRYAVALRSAGTYLVVAAAGAYQPHAALVVVGPDAVTRHDVTLAGTSGVHGLVRHGGEPVAGAAVTLIDAHGDVAAVGVTDGSGRYRLAGVPDGAYTLTAASAGHQPSASSVWLDVGITVERNLELPQRARLVGTVTAESSGRPVEEATATLVDAGGVVVGTAVTDAEGAFAFADLPAGTYTLTARGYAPAVQTVHVEAGGTTAAEITLSPGSRAIALL